MILHVKAMEATDIPSLDIIGKSDPYLLFKLNSTEKTWKTSHINNNHSPKWEEEFDIPISSNADDILTVELWDKDTLTPDDLISSLVFLIKYFPIGKVTDIWYNFNPANGVEKGGKVRLIFHLDYLDSKK